MTPATATRSVAKAVQTAVTTLWCCTARAPINRTSRTALLFSEPEKEECRRVRQCHPHLRLLLSSTKWRWRCAKILRRAIIRRFPSPRLLSCRLILFVSVTLPLSLSTSTTWSSFISRSNHPRPSVSRPATCLAASAPPSRVRNFRYIQ